MFEHIPWSKDDLKFTKEYPSVVDVLELDSDGQVVVTGQHDQQAEIDSYLDEVDINNIIRRCVDPSTLSVIGIDAQTDDSIIPDNLNDANNLINERFATAFKIYDSLTAEQKANFTSFADFMTNYEKVFNVLTINETPKTTDNNNGGNE